LQKIEDGMPESENEGKKGRIEGVIKKKGLIQQAENGKELCFPKRSRRKSVPTQWK